MSFIRKIKKKNAVYLAEVENYREGKKVKQKVIRYIGKEVDGEAVRRVDSKSIEIESIKQYMDYKILHTISNELGLTEVLGKYAKYILLLVYTQIISRKSIYRLPEYIEQTTLKELLGIEKIIDKDLYIALDELEDLDFNIIETKIFERLSKERTEKNALILDITDTYFAGSEAFWKERKGKDGKYDKLLQIALAVTKEEGFPIMHKTYEGNINNMKIFQDLLSETRLKKFNFIVVDRGMISYETIADLKNINQKIITGLRLNAKIKRDYLNIDREKIYHPDYLVKLKNTKVYAADFDFMEGKLIAVYNPEIELIKRNHAIEFGKFDSNQAKYMGYSLIYHTTQLSNAEVIKTYYEKDIVEKAFRELKSSINLNPIRKYRMNHIKAHVKICYMAYTLLSYIKYKLAPIGMSAIDGLEKLSPVYKVQLKSVKEDFSWSKTVTLTKEQGVILKLLGCSV